MSVILYDEFGKIGKEFTSKFVDEETEFLFLTVESSNGGLVLSKDIIRPSLAFVAAVNLATGEFSKKKGRLEWLLKNSSDRKGWGCDFEKYNIYHIKGRKNIPIELDEYNNCYMITELIDDGKSDPRLEKLKTKYLKPVHIEDSELGTFTLNREFSIFEGSLDWLGNDCSVILETDREDGKTANKAFAYLKALYSDVENWDMKFRRCAAHDFIDIADEWIVDDDEITEEELFEMLYISELSITPSGEATLYYIEDRDIFGGHAIEIFANLKNGKLYGETLVG